MGSKLRTLATSFRKDILALLLKDNITCRAVLEHMPDDMFKSTPEYSIIFSGLKDFFVAYGTKPRPHEFKKILKKNLKKTKLDDDYIDTIIDMTKELYAHRKYTASFVKAELYDAIKIQQFTQVIDASPALLDKGKYDELVKAINEAAHSVDEGAPMVEFWADAEDRAERRKKKVRATVPTGMSPIEQLGHGGLPRGKVGLIAASSGMGKSFLLANFGIYASLAKYATAYCTYELDDDDTMARMDSTITGVPVHELALQADRTLKQMRKMAKQKGPSPLYVHYRPTKTDTITGVRGFLERLRNEQGITPDALFVDYFDLLAFEKGYDKKYEALEENMEHLRGIAGEYNLALWTATQTNRGGMDTEQVDMNDLAGSFGKAFPVDFLITMMQNTKEKNHEVYRIYVAKSRFSEHGKMWFIRANFAKMKYDVLSIAEVRRLGLAGKAGTANVMGT